MGKINAAKLRALQKDEELLREIENIGKDYADISHHDEDWVLKQENN